MHPSCRIRKRNRRKRQKEGKTEMRKETSIEPITQEDSDVIKESQRVMKIKVMVTIVAILLLVLAAILLRDSEEGYLIKIATDDDQT